jgi:flagellar biosynthesis protein FlgN
MEPQACLKQLTGLLAEESNLLATLQQQLQREHELLVSNDVDGLEAVADARQASVVALSRLDQDRRNLCRLLGKNPDQTGLAALLKWCDPTGSLAAAHAAASRQAQSCREQNDRNGVLVNARLARLGGMLDKMGGKGFKTYDSPGIARSTPASSAGRMLSISA